MAKGSKSFLCDYLSLPSPWMQMSDYICYCFLKAASKLSVTGAASPRGQARQKAHHGRRYGAVMAKRYGRPSLHYRYEHYDPRF